MARRKMTLAGQLLVLQLLIVLAVLVVVGAIGYAQSSHSIERDEGRRALSAAENLAAQRIVRERVGVAEPGQDRALAAAGEANRTVSGASLVAITRPDGTVLASSDPTLSGRALPLGGSDVLAGRSWYGRVDIHGQELIVAHVPVQQGLTGEMIGIAVIGRDVPSLVELLQSAVPDMVAYLGVASGLGLLGSILLSRRIKRQTFGLEPVEIEAMLHGIKEGVIALDPAERVTLVNDTALSLLGLPADAPGRTLTDLEVDEQVRDVLTQKQSGPDRLLLAGDRVVAFNRMPMRSRGSVIG